MEELIKILATQPLAAALIIIGGLVYIIWATVLRKKNPDEEQATESYVRREVEAKMKPVLDQITRVELLLTEHVRASDRVTNDYYETRGRVEGIADQLEDLRETVQTSQREIVGKITSLLDAVRKN